MSIAGVKNTELERIQFSTDRNPAYRVEIWNPRKTTIQDVVLNRWSGNSFDVSQWVESVVLSQNQVFENNDDAVSQRATFRIVWDDVGFDLPSVRIPITSNLFRDGTPIRVYEGDRTIDRDNWKVVFTGLIRGFAGAQRAKRGVRMIVVTAFGRAQAFQDREIVGISFPYDTDLGDMARGAAIQEMGLEPEEILFGRFGYLGKHKTHALTRISPMEGIFNVMYHVGRKPYFNGEGKLVAHDTSFDKPPIRTYDHHPNVVEVSRVQNLLSTVTSVQVTGLDYRLSKITRPTALLASVDSTVGYFDSSYHKVIRYSEDNRLKAENTSIDVKHSGSFLSGGGSASWAENDEFSGTLTIDTEYAPWLLGVIASVWVIGKIAEYSLDKAIADGVAPPGSTTVRYILQVALALDMFLLMITMSKIGRWSVDVFGDPYEHVYKELRAIAALEGIATAEHREKKYTMQMLSDIDAIVARAKDLLRRELAKQQTYRVVLKNDAVIEPDDIVEIRDGAFGLNDYHRFYITDVERQYSRGPARDEMVCSAWLIKTVTG